MNLIIFLLFKNTKKIEDLETKLEEHETTIANLFLDIKILHRNNTELTKKLFILEGINLGNENKIEELIQRLDALEDENLKMSGINNSHAVDQSMEKRIKTVFFY